MWYRAPGNPFVLTSFWFVALISKYPDLNGGVVAKLIPSYEEHMSTTMQPFNDHSMSQDSRDTVRDE
jgi:hypothetical protein